ncbi:MAG: hypothetical protein IKR47_08125 [Lachnospiraceae bacterium]|nr:hypothetical protein [Lachnospiraceae bacterium]
MDSARTYTSVRTDVKQFKSVMVQKADLVGQMEADALSRIKAQCINYLLRWLFGLDDEELNRFVLKNGQGMGGANMMKVTYTEESSFYESEQTDFSTGGKVICADGREIEFDMQISMSRSFESAFSATYEEMRAIDPLVINLDCNVADVSDQKFFFDLDADGNPDEISKPAFGTGFLALDRNEDGEIGDGSELFGTKSGNGFADLAKFDSDGNGWIDEADEIFGKLKIYGFDAEGNPELYTLKEKGVGAIGLQSVGTQFSLNHAETNVTNAYIRRTGIFLYENGGAGSVQQMDLVRA